MPVNDPTYEALEQRIAELEKEVVKHRQAEKVWRVSEERFRLISSITSNYFYSLSVSSNGSMKVDWVGGAFQRITGHAPENIYNLEKWLTFIHPDDLSISKRAIKATLSNQPSVFEYRIRTKAGGERRLRDHIYPIWDGKKKRVTSVIGAVRDITQRRKSEEEGMLLKTAIEQASESVMITDSDGKIQYINPASELTTGFSRKELIGHDSGILQNGRSDQAFYQSMWKTLTSGQVWKGRFINKKKDGSLYEEASTISPVKNARGEITNYVTVKRDVTEEIRREKQLQKAQKMEAIGTLAGGIAHDFNNILSAIIGYSEMCLDKVHEDSTLHDYLQEVLKAGMRARELVKQILVFSHRTEQELKPIQIRLVVKEALKLLRASLPSTIEIRQNIQSDETVLADPTQIHQILMNLCTNAAHAMREKGGTLGVRLMNVDAGSEFVEKNPDITPGRYQRLTVSDTGHGMSQEVLERIFDPFFTTKEKGEGTGMGLSVVHGIVKTHGGAIRVCSEPGKETVFNVYLPVINRKAESEAAIHKPLACGTEHILFVDDEQMLGDIAKRMLERLGYQVTTRTDSIEAFELFKARPDEFDLVITDQTMPNMTGKELAGEMLKIRPDIPIILCTGFSEMINEEVAAAMGIRSFLLKPLTLDDIARTVRKVLDR